uniref:BAHD acyltransferase DCR n=2 Tax=Elaeis guineensis var. tenera TaxID=51953 RepID=A0A6I9S0K1_ELAGV|nr:BAHD acyltransferase DCR [Elaeis guineensis]
MAVENGMPEEAKAESVKVINKTTVFPEKKPEKATCLLNTFDLPYITFYYNQKLMLYKGGEFEENVGRLKEGLGKVLEYFYPLAGKLRQDEEGVLVVDCETPVGAEVVEAAAEGVAVADLAEGEATGLLQELVPYTGVMNLEGLRRPLLAVQFTKLKDGLAIGCAFNHAILDGNSTWHFMSSWAELCRGAPSISIAPLLDRTKARPTRVPLSLPASPQEHELADPNGAPKPLLAKLFSFSGPAVDRIKTRANANLPPDAKPLSTFQSLGAHVWSAVCRARTLKPDDLTVFAVFIDCRSRVEPPLPDAYFGNLIQAIFTVTASGLLLASPPEFGASAIQKVIDAHDAGAIRKRLEEYEAKPKMFYYSDAGFNCVAVGSSPRFKVYDVDFGFGRPERVRGGSNNKFDGMVYLYPGREGGRSIDVELTLQKEAMQNLEKDGEFLMVDAA